MQLGIAHLIELTSVGTLIPVTKPFVILTHRLEVEVEENDAKHEEDGEEGVEVEWYSLAEQGQSVLASRHESRYCRCPTGDRGDDADGGCRGVDEISQLLLGHAIANGDRAHHRTHGEAVEVIIDEYQDAQQDGGYLHTHLRLDVLGSPSTEGCRTASLVHQ